MLKILSPGEHLRWQIVIYTCMITNKAWSLNISAAAQWNSGLEDMLSFIMDIHPLLIWMKTKGTRVDEEKPRGSRCHHICRAAMFLTYFDPTGSGQTNKQTQGDVREWDIRVQWWEQGFAHWYLHVTLDRLENISQLFFCFNYALKPKIFIFIFFFTDAEVFLWITPLFFHILFFFSFFFKHSKLCYHSCGPLVYAFKWKIQSVSSSIKNTVSLILNCDISYFYM